MLESASLNYWHTQKMSPRPIERIINLETCFPLFGTYGFLHTLYIYLFKISNKTLSLHYTVYPLLVCPQARASENVCEYLCHVFKQKPETCAKYRVIDEKLYDPYLSGLSLRFGLPPALGGNPSHSIGDLDFRLRLPHLIGSQAALGRLRI